MFHALNWQTNWLSVDHFSTSSGGSPGANYLQGNRREDNFSEIKPHQNLIVLNWFVIKLNWERFSRKELVGIYIGRAIRKNAWNLTIARDFKPLGHILRTSLKKSGAVPE